MVSATSLLPSKEVYQIPPVDLLENQSLVILRVDAFLGVILLTFLCACALENTIWETSFFLPMIPNYLDSPSMAWSWAFSFGNYSFPRARCFGAWLIADCTEYSLLIPPRSTLYPSIACSLPWVLTCTDYINGPSCFFLPSSVRYRSGNSSTPISPRFLTIPYGSSTAYSWLCIQCFVHKPSLNYSNLIIRSHLSPYPGWLQHSFICSLMFLVF